MTIFLVRHGETEMNAGRIVQTVDARLSARGVAQARRVAERLAGEGLGRVLASDLPRAVQTAERIVARTGAELTLEPLLQERSFGDLRGTPYADLEFDLFAPEVTPPNGETWDVFRSRVARAWERVEAQVADTEGPLAVVTHGLVLRALIERHVAVPTELAPAPIWHNGCVTVVEGPEPAWTVRLLACSAHLERLELGDLDAPTAVV